MSVCFSRMSNVYNNAGYGRCLRFYTLFQHLLDQFEIVFCELRSGNAQLTVNLKARPSGDVLMTVDFKARLSFILATL